MMDLITQTHAAVDRVAASARQHLLALFTGGKAPEPHAITHLLQPLARRYKRLHTNVDDAKAEMVENAALLTGFTPEVCAAAYKEIAKTWETDWHPPMPTVLATCRRVHNEQPHVKEAFTFLRAMRQHYCTTSDQFEKQGWPPELGPMPGCEGCRMPQELQDKGWRELLRSLLHDSSGSWMFKIEWKDGAVLPTITTRDDKPVDDQTVLETLGIGVTNRLTWFGIDVFDPSKCPIPRGLLDACNVPRDRAWFETEFMRRHKEEKATEDAKWKARAEEWKVNFLHAVIGAHNDAQGAERLAKRLARRFANMDGGS